MKNKYHLLKFVQKDNRYMKYYQVLKSFYRQYKLYTYRSMLHIDL